MMFRSVSASLCWILLASPAYAEVPWLSVHDLGDDAVAEAPPATEADTEPDELQSIDLKSLTTALESGMRRVVVDGADPMTSLPVDLTPAPETTQAELRGLLAGTGARRVRLHAVEAHAVLWQGTTPVHAMSITWLPSATSRLLSLREIPVATPGIGTPPAPVPPASTGLVSGMAKLPGGLARSWTAAEAALDGITRNGRCDGLPVASDAALATVVPSAYLDTGRAARDGAAAARRRLCAVARETSWDRMELRLQALHYNLYNEAGDIEGGLLLRVDPVTGAFAYPLFKKTGE